MLLLLLQSVLGIDAVMNQRNVVQVETLNFSNERVHLPILSLTLGRNDMVSCDVIQCRIMLRYRRCGERE